MVDLASTIIGIVKKSLHLYYEEKDMNYLLGHCLNDDIPIIGMLHPDWTGQCVIKDEHYQFFRQSEHNFIVYGKYLIHSSEMEEELERNVTFNCLLNNSNEVQFNCIHMSVGSSKRLALDVSACKVQDEYREMMEDMYDVFVEYDNVNGEFYYNAERMKECFGADNHFVNLDQFFWFLCTECVAEEDCEKMDIFRSVDIEKRVRNNDRKIEFDIKLRKKGEAVYRWYHMYIVFFPNEVYNINKLCWMMKDIDAEKKEQLDNIHNSRRDYLTGVFNRRYMETLVRHELTDLKGFNALIVADIDNFKGINDRFGHLTGDQIIRNSIEQMNSSISTRDWIGRMGGDEFCIMLRGRQNESELQAVMDELHRKTGYTYVEGNQTMEVHMSFGAVILQPGIPGAPALDFEQLYEVADNALYDVKRNGKNFYKAKRFN